MELPVHSQLLDLFFIRSEYVFCQVSRQNANLTKLAFCAFTFWPVCILPCLHLDILHFATFTFCHLWSLSFKFCHVEILIFVMLKFCPIGILSLLHYVSFAFCNSVRFVFCYIFNLHLVVFAFSKVYIFVCFFTFSYI